MRVDDVMSSPAVTVRPGTPVRAAAALLAAHGFTAAPVVGESGALTGLVTEEDLVRDRIPHAHDATAAPPATVADVLGPGAPRSVAPGDDLAAVARVLATPGVRTLPVVDGGRLVGVVTRRDLLRVVAHQEVTSEQVRRRRGLPPAGAAPAPDDDPLVDGASPVAGPW